MQLRFAPVALVVFLSGAAGCTRAEPNEALPGVRLGMTPRDVRDRFEGGDKGQWQTKIGGGAGASDDTVVEWSAADPASRVGLVRFEFHLGMLVAIRGHLRDAIAAERVDLTPKTVTVRKPGGGGTDLTILARDCPTHHDEAEALATRAKISQ